jgi:hypothetical protein
VNSSWLNRNMDRILYVLIIACVSYAIISPIGLPIEVSKETRALYDFIETIPAGKAVYMGFDYQASSMAEIEPNAVALMRHFFSRDIKVVGAGITAESGALMDKVIGMIREEFPDKQYGVDWVNIGYKPGTTVFLQALTVSISDAAGGVDYQGTPLDTLPLMQEVKSLKDVAIACSMGSLNEGLSSYVKMIGTPIGIPVTGACFAVSIPESIPLYQAGQLTGLLQGMRGAAEYEQLIQKPGTAAAGMDAQSLTHLLIIAFVIVGNVQYFLEKSKKGGNRNV